jgi:hypothetical protein
VINPGVAYDKVATSRKTNLYIGSVGLVIAVPAIAERENCSAQDSTESTDEPELSAPHTLVHVT